MKEQQQNGKFIRQKCYLEEFDNKIQITCAGLPQNCYDQVTWDNFKEGFTAHGKLTYKYVKGGVKLIETDFTIKEENIKQLDLQVKIQLFFDVQSSKR